MKFTVKWQWKILISLIPFLQFYLLYWTSLNIVGVPEEQWLDIREGFLNNQRNHNEASEVGETEEDPIIAEARKLVGDDLIEINE